MEQSKYKRDTPLGQLAIMVYENGDKLFLATPDDVFDVSATGNMHRCSGLADVVRAANEGGLRPPLPAELRDDFEFDPPGMTGYRLVAHMDINSVDGSRCVTLRVDDMDVAALRYFGIGA